jgi:hypothetical protein
MTKVKENKSKIEFYEEVKKHISREGVDNLLDWLSENDFFEAPASTQFHGCFDQGLVIHSLNVFDSAMSLNEIYKLNLNEESIAICSLFHDLCKVNFYKKETRNKKINGVWKEIEVWGVEDKLPMGHGEKSVYLINKFIKLKDEEALAIRWHLGGFDPAVHFYYPYGSSNKQAFRENKLVSVIAIADLTASYILGE